MFAFGPRVDVGVDGLLHVSVQAGGDTFAFVGDDGADLVDADARHPAVGAFQPLGVLSVVLQEPPGQGDDQVRVVDCRKEVAFADVGSGRAADVDLPLVSLDGDHDEVFAQRFGAVAGASGDGEFHLAGPGDPLEAFVESPTPNRQKSVPTQVFTVRKLLP